MALHLTKSRTRKVLMQYHGFSLGLLQISHLKKLGRLEEYETNAQGLANHLEDLRGNMRYVDNVAFYLGGYHFDFKRAAGLLKAIKGNNPPSDSELHKFHRSIPHPTDPALA